MEHQTSSRLLSLPGEVRNQIWNDVLASTCYRGYRRARSGCGFPWSTPSLPATNRQIRSEASGLYYSTEPFLFLLDDCQKWLASRDSEALKLLRRISINEICCWPRLRGLYYWPSLAIEAVIEKYSHLEDLQIEFGVLTKDKKTKFVTSLSDAMDLNGV